MKLQKSTLLALYSVLEFAGQPGRHVPAFEVAERYGESLHHLAKVLATLAHAGIVESVRGVGGGYRFIANPRRLTMLDVIALFERIEGNGDDADDGARATPADRALGDVLGEIDQTARATFGSITIATLLKRVARYGATAGTRLAASRP